MKCKRDSDGRSYDHLTLQTMRIRAVRAHGEGVEVADIATSMGVSPKTVYRWLSDFLTGGQSALQSKPLLGRPRLLSAEQMAWVAKAVRETSPLQHKFVFGLWTLNLMRQLISREFKITLGTASVWRLMRLMGFTTQKPIYQAWQQDAVLVRKWESETFPEIKARAKQLGAEIYFADEASIRSDHHVGSTWATKGETPVLKATGRRFSLNMLSAISVRGELNFMVSEGRVDAAVFIEFLSRLMIGKQKPVFLIVDGHPVHRSRAVRDFVATFEGNLELHFLPPYAPQLNPAENVWSNVKRQVSRRVAHTSKELSSFVNDAFIGLGALKELILGFFKQPECSYI